MLSKFESDVLALVRDQHAETRRGARGDIVFAGMSAKAKDRKAKVLTALESLKKAGLLISGPYGWVPSQDAAAALDDVDDTDVVDMEEEQAAPVAAEAECDWNESRMDVIGQNGPSGEHYASLPPELLNRCATMHRALLAQAEKAHAGGDPTAWRELHWLMETGSQLLAAGGLAHD